MKKAFLFFSLLFLILTTSYSFGQVNPNSTYVNGYYKSNGTYVNGYNRTTPNKTINDNYSTRPNYNPYTGKQGTVSPSPSYGTYYSTPKYNTPTYNRPTYKSTYPKYR